MGHKGDRGDHRGVLPHRLACPASPPEAAAFRTACRAKRPARGWPTPPAQRRPCAPPGRGLAHLVRYPFRFVCARHPAGFGCPPGPVHAQRPGKGQPPGDSPSPPPAPPRVHGSPGALAAPGVTPGEPLSCPFNGSKAAWTGHFMGRSPGADGPLRPPQVFCHSHGCFSKRFCARTRGRPNRKSPAVRNSKAFLTRTYAVQRLSVDNQSIT